MKTKNILLGALLAVALVFGTGAMSLRFRDYYIHHLSVKPGTSSTMALTNVFEVATASGTNRFGAVTNSALGGASITGPRLYVTLGGTNYYAMTNGWISGTNVAAGGPVLWRVINGLVVEATAGTP